MCHFWRRARTSDVAFSPVERSKNYSITRKITHTRVRKYRFGNTSAEFPRKFARNDRPVNADDSKGFLWSCNHAPWLLPILGKCLAVMLAAIITRDSTRTNDVTNNETQNTTATTECVGTLLLNVKQSDFHPKSYFVIRFFQWIDYLKVLEQLHAFRLRLSTLVYKHKPRTSHQTTDSLKLKSHLHKNFRNVMEHVMQRGSKFLRTWTVVDQPLSIGLRWVVVKSKCLCPKKRIEDAHVTFRGRKECNLYLNLNLRTTSRCHYVKRVKNLIKTA